MLSYGVERGGREREEAERGGKRRRERGGRRKRGGRERGRKREGYVNKELYGPIEIDGRKERS